MTDYVVMFYGRVSKSLPTTKVTTAQTNENLDTLEMFQKKKTLPFVVGKIKLKQVCDSVIRIELHEKMQLVKICLTGTKQKISK